MCHPKKPKDRQREAGGHFDEFAAGEGLEDTAAWNRCQLAEWEEIRRERSFEHKTAQFDNDDQQGTDHFKQFHETGTDDAYNAAVSERDISEQNDTHDYRTPGKAASGGVSPRHEIAATDREQRCQQAYCPAHDDRHCVRSFGPWRPEAFFVGSGRTATLSLLGGLRGPSDLFGPGIGGPGDFRVLLSSSSKFLTEELIARLFGTDDEPDPDHGREEQEGLAERVEASGAVDDFIDGLEDVPLRNGNGHCLASHHRQRGVFTRQMPHRDSEQGGKSERQHRADTPTVRWFAITYRTFIATVPTR